MSRDPIGSNKHITSSDSTVSATASHGLTQQIVFRKPAGTVQYFCPIQPGTSLSPFVLHYFCTLQPARYPVFLPVQYSTSVNYNHQPPGAVSPFYITSTYFLHACAVQYLCTLHPVTSFMQVQYLYNTASYFLEGTSFPQVQSIPPVTSCPLCRTA